MGMGMVTRGEVVRWCGGKDWWGLRDGRGGWG